MRGLICILATAMLSAVEPWPGALPATPITTADATIALADGGSATLRVHFPAQGDGPWPLVIFSHGLAGSREGYAFLGTRWAAHGYVVVHPDHPGSDAASFRRARPGELTGALLRSTTDPAVLRGRPKLIAQLIDALSELEKAVPALVGRIDRNCIGVGGHSFGAWTTMAVAGQRMHIPGGEDFDGSDPRPRAFAALSPNGRSLNTRDGDWAGCTRPLLLMTGSDDNVPVPLKITTEPRDGAWRRQAFELVPAGGKLLVWFDGGLHSTYSAGVGARLMGEQAPDPAQVEAVAVTTLAWWDAQLRADPRARAWLADPASAAALGSWARFSAR